MLAIVKDGGRVSCGVWCVTLYHQCWVLVMCSSQP